MLVNVTIDDIVFGERRTTKGDDGTTISYVKGAVFGAGMVIFSYIPSRNSGMVSMLDPDNMIPSERNTFAVDADDLDGVIDGFIEIVNESTIVNLLFATLKAAAGWHGLTASNVRERLDEARSAAGSGN